MIMRTCTANSKRRLNTTLEYTKMIHFVVNESVYMFIPFYSRQHISPQKETSHHSYKEIMDNTYFPSNKILGTTIIILTHVVRIHAFISSNQIKELSV